MIALSLPQSFCASDAVTTAVSRRSLYFSFFINSVSSFVKSVSACASSLDTFSNCASCSFFCISFIEDTGTEISFWRMEERRSMSSFSLSNCLLSSAPIPAASIAPLSDRRSIYPMARIRSDMLNMEFRSLLRYPAFVA